MTVRRLGRAAGVARAAGLCAALLCGTLAACSPATAKTAASADFAEASSAGDPATATAIRLDADFQCPAEAADAGQPGGAPLAGRKLEVVTTVAPITSIVANVAGDRADVRGVIPEGQDSHTYEPKPGVAAALSRADVVFVNGLSLENPTRDLAKSNIPARSQLIELGSIVLKPEQYIYDFSFPRDGGKPNPHLWTNPPMASCYAAIAASVLSRSDPTNADYYLANARRLEAKIDDLDQRFRTASNTLPPERRKLLTYHDAFAYFAAHYRWKIIGAVQMSSFEDPTPKEVARLIRQIKAEKIPAIFGSEVFPSTVLAQIGKEAGVKYVDQLRDDDLPGNAGDPGHSYLGLMKADFVTIITGLGGDASSLESFDPSDVTRDDAVYLG